MYQIRSRPQKIHFRRLRKIYRKFLASRKSVLDCSRQTRKKRSDKTQYRAAQLRKIQFIGSNEKNPRTQQRYTDFLAAPGRACVFGAKLRGHARSARTAPVQRVRTLHRLRSDATVLNIAERNDTIDFAFQRVLFLPCFVFSANSA